MTYLYQTLVESRGPPIETSQLCDESDLAYSIGGPNFWNYEEDLINWFGNNQINNDMYWFQPIYDSVFSLYFLERLKKMNEVERIVARNSLINVYISNKYVTLSNTHLELLEGASNANLSDKEFISIIMKLPWKVRVVYGI